MNSGLKGTNLIGKKHFTKITIQANATEKLLFAFCQGITLYYWDKPEYQNLKHLIVMNHIYIIGEDTGNMYHGRNPVGIHVVISTMENLLIVINNSIFF